MTEWNMYTQEPYFSLVNQGKKIFEGRAPNPEKPHTDYAKMCVGDILKFILVEDKKTVEDKWFKTAVQSIYHFDTPEIMLETLGLEKMLLGIKTIEEGGMVYRSFPGYVERIEKYGIFAFGIGEIIEKSEGLK